MNRKDLQSGKSAYRCQTTSYDENKKVLTPRNLISEVYKFAMRCLHPVIVPIRYCVLYAMQSGSYIPSPEWLKLYNKMDAQQSEYTWNLLFKPRECRLQHVDQIFFDFRNSLASRSAIRYTRQPSYEEIPNRAEAGEQVEENPRSTPYE